jgi:hypothetical protein
MYQQLGWIKNPPIPLDQTSGRVLTSQYPMSILQKLFSRKPKQRIRVCVECGMPVADHKTWCSILRTQQEYDRKAASAQRS